jgi:SAM-dependent methyltransferase
MTTRARTEAWSSATLREEKFWPIDLFTRSLTLLVANKLGVFEQLAGGPRPLVDIATNSGADLKGMRILLDALVVLEYLKKTGELYENENDTTLYMTKGSREYIGTRLLHIYDGLDRWLRLEDLVRHGQKYKYRLPEFHKTPAEQKKRTREFTIGLSESSRSTAALVAKMLDLRGVKDLLDVGGGAGTYSIEFVRKQPKLRAVVFELPIPARVAREQAKAAGLEKRIRVEIGDFLSHNLGKQVYDAVFLSNIIHNLSADDNRRLLEKAWVSLRSGGRIIVKDMMPNDRRDGPYYPLIFALTMLMFTDSGDTYSEAEVRRWLKEIGFVRLSRKTVIRGENSILIGWKK